MEKLGTMELRPPARWTEAASGSAPPEQGRACTWATAELQLAMQMESIQLPRLALLHPVPDPLPLSAAGAWPEVQSYLLVSFWANSST